MSDRKEGEGTKGKNEEGRRSLNAAGRPAWLADWVDGCDVRRRLNKDDRSAVIQLPSSLAPARSLFSPLSFFAQPALSCRSISFSIPHFTIRSIV